MKKINVKDIMFWGIFTLMLVCIIGVYINGTANAVEENEEVERTWWICGDYANGEMKAKRFANELHTSHVNHELYNVEYDDMLDGYDVFYLDQDAGMYTFKYFYD